MKHPTFALSEANASLRFRTLLQYEQTATS
jgi:hypothetical protein